MKKPTTLLGRVEALEAAADPVEPVRLICYVTAPDGSLSVQLDGVTLAQLGSESPEVFKDRVTIAARQRPGQAVVLLSELDAAL